MAQRPHLIVGNSAETLALKGEIERVARSDAKVLITGESGSGKEQVALSIHALGLRAERPFVAVNCAGVPETLLEAELFGHVKGSFTGAYRHRQGKLELAHHGTMLLDEVGEMSLRMQAVLLRFLETGEVQKVGAERAEGRLDVRVIAATNRSLPEMVRQGMFREDLYYRLNVIHIHVPPLRERRADIPALVAHFLERFAPGDQALRVSPEAMEALALYRWPGNVRELANIVERVAVTIRGVKPSIDPADLPEEILRSGQPAHVREAATRAQSEIDDLYERLLSGRTTFWSGVHAPFSLHDMKRSELRALIAKGLRETHGSYKLLLQLFGMAPGDYKRFLWFLKKHDCHIPFQAFRRVAPVENGGNAAAPGDLKVHSEDRPWTT